MANITSYPKTTSLLPEDLFIISDTSQDNVTKSVELSTLSAYIGSGGGGGGTGTVTSVTGTGSVSGITLSGNVTSSGSLTLGGSLSLTSQEIINFLGYTPSSFDGDYNNLTNKPSLFDGAYNSLTGKPTLFDGDYNNLTNKPAIPDAVFKNFAVDGQTTVVADSVSDTLTLVAGDNITIATDSALDTITINALSTLNNNFAEDITVNGITVGVGDGNETTNTVLGRFAFSNNNFPSIWNVAVGYEALKNNSQATFNTAVGTGSMGTNTVTGSFNVGLGYNSLKDITGGESNVAIGRDAQQGNRSGLRNVSMGSSSMYTTINNAIDNVAVGYQSLYYLSEGENNTALGTTSGYAGSSYISNDCVFIGFRSQPSGIGYTNQIVIGSRAVGKGANTAQIGDDNITALHVGGNGAGLVLKSPNGTAYKITVSDAGAITATAV